MKREIKTEIKHMTVAEFAGVQQNLPQHVESSKLFVPIDAQILSELQHLNEQIAVLIKHITNL